MKKLLIIISCLLTFSACEKESIGVSSVSTFDNLQTIDKIKNKDGFLMRVNSDLTVIVAQGDTDNFDLLSCVAIPSERYVVGNLPEELKGKDNVRIVFSGEVKQAS